MTVNVLCAGGEFWQMGLLVDSFAGGGGASTGFRLALGRDVDIAINHDPEAIRMHLANHPNTKHYCESVWDVDPREACAGKPVDLAWFSPDCKHFSKAKGAALVDKGIRGLAWIVLRWAGTVRPSVIILENVEEFVTWGPVRKGKPIKSRKGETFRQWLTQLQSLGYVVEYRELVAADYGAPTSRKRFYLVARCDGNPIVWPEPTHASPDTLDAASGWKKPWRTAAEIIDWSLPCPSIFASKREIKEQYGVNAVRPLADNTLKRIARGIDKFTIKNAKPFIVPIGYGERDGQAARIQSADAPLGTVVSSAKHYACDSLVQPFIALNNDHCNARGLGEPVATITTGNRNLLCEASMMAIGQTGFASDRIYGADEPVKTIVSKAEQCVIAPSLIQYHTEQSENVRGQAMDEPVRTVDAANRYGVAAAQLAEWHGTARDGHDVRDPLKTQLAKDHEALTLAMLSEYYGNGQDGLSIDNPMHTVTVKDREALTVAQIQKYYDGGYDGAGSRCDEPLGTVTQVDHNALTLAHIAEFKGNDKGQRADDPLRTITASAGEFGEVKTRVERYAPGADMQYWPDVRDMLNRFCGYSLADDEVLLINIAGAWYFIADIGLRMLAPRELYNAQSFPGDYIIEFDADGKPYPKSEQVARCGNSVCPVVAAALIKSNAPESARRENVA